MCVCVWSHMLTTLLLFKQPAADKCDVVVSGNDIKKRIKRKKNDGALLRICVRKTTDWPRLILEQNCMYVCNS